MIANTAAKLTEQALRAVGDGLTILDLCTVTLRGGQSQLSLTRELVKVTTRPSRG